MDLWCSGWTCGVVDGPRGVGDVPRGVVDGRSVVGWLVVY